MRAYKLLMKALKEKQEERGETQAQFAEYLDLSQPTLSRIYSNDRGIGGHVLAKILAKYPEFASFFLSNYTYRN